MHWQSTLKSEVMRPTGCCLPRLSGVHPIVHYISGLGFEGEIGDREIGF